MARTSRSVTDTRVEGGFATLGLADPAGRGRLTTRGLLVTRDTRISWVAQVSERSVSRFWQSLRACAAAAANAVGFRASAPILTSRRRRRPSYGRPAGLQVTLGWPDPSMVHVQPVIPNPQKPDSIPGQAQAHVGWVRHSGESR